MVYVQAFARLAGVGDIFREKTQTRAKIAHLVRRLLCMAAHVLFRPHYISLIPRGPIHLVVQLLVLQRPQTGKIHDFIRLDRRPTNDKIFPTKRSTCLAIG